MRLGVIGAGRVGASFVMAWPSEVAGILCSSKEHTEAAAKHLGVDAYSGGASLAADADVLLLTVNDDSIAPLCKSLANALAERKAARRAFVYHCSGSLDLSPLEPLRQLGYSVGSIHPLQSFAKPCADFVKGIYMAIDGDEAAKEKAKDIVSSLGSIPFHVPAQDRALYHAAACFCSNYAVTVLSIAQTLMSRWTETKQDASKALLPLAQGTMGNVEKNPIWSRALTGPIARGDLGTVQKHLAVLPEKLIPVYRTLGMETAALALDNGTIDEGAYRQMIRLLAKTEGDHQDEKSD